jgi:flagellar biogenesis protein FliO
MEGTQRPGLAKFAAAVSISVSRWLATLGHAVRRVKLGRATRSLRVCENLALGDRRALLLVQCDRRRYLIGAAGQSITLIDRLDEHSDVALEEEVPSARQVVWKGLH